MSSNHDVPGYELEDVRVISSAKEFKALADPLREVILDLLLERAATVAELAAAVGRPRSTVAHHVGVLVGADMLKVVRTRRVRAVDERWYGRTARIFYAGPVPQQPPVLGNYLAEAAAESAPAYAADDLRALSRHALIPRESVREFWARVMELAQEFSQLPRGGDTVYGFVAGLYPTDFPRLPPAAEDEGGAHPGHPGR